jgi:hypothetical protein
LKDDGMPALQSNMMMMMTTTTTTMMMMMMMMMITVVVVVVVVVMPSIHIGSITCNCMRMALNNTIVRVNFFQN